MIMSELHVELFNHSAISPAVLSICGWGACRYMQRVSHDSREVLSVEMVRFVSYSISCPAYARGPLGRNDRPRAAPLTS